jgi:hypothetical protein
MGVSSSAITGKTIIAPNLAATNAMNRNYLAFISSFLPSLM